MQRGPPDGQAFSYGMSAQSPRSDLLPHHLELPGKARPPGDGRATDLAPLPAGPINVSFGIRRPFAEAVPPAQSWRYILNTG